MHFCFPRIKNVQLFFLVKCMSHFFAALLSWFWGTVWWNSPLLCRQTWDSFVNSLPSQLQSLLTKVPEDTWLLSPVHFILINDHQDCPLPCLHPQWRCCLSLWSQWWSWRPPPWAWGKMTHRSSSRLLSKSEKCPPPSLQWVQLLQKLMFTTTWCPLSQRKADSKLAGGFSENCFISETKPWCSGETYF